jgi:tetratricopeptide (TPR) repeat protein
MKTTLRMALVLLVVLALVPAHVEAQKKKKKKKKTDDTDVVALYERGAYDEVADAVTRQQEAGVTNPEALYIAGLSYEGLKKSGPATAAYTALVEATPDTDAWHWVGASARALAAGDIGAATEAATRAVQLDPGNKFGHYQRGMALSHQKVYQPAADEFVSLLEIDGGFAYGHYYAALSYYQLRSLVAATNHFERFLELAPDAPERVQVEGILAALRGS